MSDSSSAPERALRAIATELDRRQRAFALVGGLAISVRAEVRFTRDVDLVVVVRDDADAESLVRDLSGSGYRPIALIEHDSAKRLSAARMIGREDVVVDLMFATTGFEAEIAARAEPLTFPGVGSVRVASADDLLAMKILSMRDGRLQDRIDAENLIELGEIDLAAVREALALIRTRGFDRGQDLEAKLASMLDAIARAKTQ